MMNSQLIARFLKRNKPITTVSFAILFELMRKNNIQKIHLFEMSQTSKFLFYMTRIHLFVYGVGRLPSVKHYYLS